MGAPDPDPVGGLSRAAFEARDEAAPFAVAAVAILVAQAVVSHVLGWRLAWDWGWWVWAAAALPEFALAAVLVTGLGRPRAQRGRRALITGLLGAVLVWQVALVAVLVATMLRPPGGAITGGQLLASAAAVWVTDIIAFGLVYWDLDDGGPVHRAMHVRRAPDLQFPQDENPGLSRPGWSPSLVDYMYVSFTNSIAFSPTDTMPLSRGAKALMAMESALSVMAVLLVAARAINTLT